MTKTKQDMTLALEWLNSEIEKSKERTAILILEKEKAEKELEWFDANPNIIIADFTKKEEK